ncbi:hypothetical protein fugu_017451 [Takifugu bimaculatus]|uniref:Major facilitator superfamily (MFS) profile domain-containing protein n=1 Tax=Takifugu bimaculatus TaxID=433685 RepID=A0A4Z2BRZ6_9TELE|nr:hypothetical protein fugu_017451 [Takifugu bimaculatus]
MAGRTCTVWAIWFIGSLGYYVFSLGSVNLGGNQYINLFLVGAVELPSYMVGCYLMDRIGRKKTCAPALLLAGVACMLIIVLPADIDALAIALSMTGKFSVAIAFGLIYLYTCEALPNHHQVRTDKKQKAGGTGDAPARFSLSFASRLKSASSASCRTLAVGSGSMMCRVGSVVAPFCVYLADVWVYLPQLIVGVLAFAIGLLTLLLPETLGQPLTNTLEEAEALGGKSSNKCSGLCGKDEEAAMEMNQQEATASAGKPED